jgi:hypothetical protein
VGPARLPRLRSSGRGAWPSPSAQSVTSPTTTPDVMSQLRIRPPIGFAFHGADLEIEDLFGTNRSIEVPQSVSVRIISRASSSPMLKYAGWSRAQPA